MPTAPNSEPIDVNLIGIEERHGPTIIRLTDEICLVQNANNAKNWIRGRTDTDLEFRNNFFDLTIGLVKRYALTRGFENDNLPSLVVQPNLTSARYWESLSYKAIMTPHEDEIRRFLDFQIGSFELIKDKDLRFKGVASFIQSLRHNVPAIVRMTHVANAMVLNALSKWTEDKIARMKDHDRIRHIELEQSKETDWVALNNEVMKAMKLNRNEPMPPKENLDCNCPNAKKFFDYLTTIRENPFESAPPISEAMRDHILYSWFGYGKEVPHPGSGNHQLTTSWLVFLLKKLSIYYKEKYRPKYPMRNLVSGAHSTFSDLFPSTTRESFASNYNKYEKIGSVPECLDPKNWAPNGRA